MAPRAKRRPSRRIDITPSVEELVSKRNSEMSAAQCFAEFIDNSIDADAKSIVIRVDDGAGVVRVCDDGNGMDSAASALRSGRHVASGSKQGSSRYGVGMKDAGWRLGAAFVVDSVKDGRRSRATADCDKIIKRGKWVVTERVGRTTKRNGTQIIVTRVDFPLGGNMLTRVRTELEKIYPDAMRAGVKISVNDVRLVPSLAPVLRVERTHEIMIGRKRCRVRGGILAPGQDWVQAGVMIRLPFRVICRGERAGFDGYDVSEFYADVELLEDKDDRQTWFRVTDHKNSLFEKTAICREVARLFKDMLKAQDSSHVITIPIPKAPQKTGPGSMIVDPQGITKVSGDPGEVGNEHGEERGEDHDPRRRDCDPPGKLIDESGSKAAKPKRKRGYDISISFSNTSPETVSECRCGEKSASVVLGRQSDTFRNYTEGKDKGALRDSVSFFAVAAALVTRSSDDPKTPLDSLVDDSEKTLDRILGTFDSIINQSKARTK
jgi:hypothetical protein